MGIDYMHNSCTTLKKPFDHCVHIGSEKLAPFGVLLRMRGAEHTPIIFALKTLHVVVNKNKWIFILSNRRESGVREKEDDYFFHVGVICDYQVNLCRYKVNRWVKKVRGCQDFLLPFAAFLDRLHMHLSYS